MDWRNSGRPCVGPYFVQPSARALWPASITLRGVGKSGSPISRWMMLLPWASSARAFTRTSNADSTPIRAILSTRCMVIMLLPQGLDGLEQRRVAPLPGLAFFFGDLFHVVHVSAGLGQHVVQVVAHAYKREAFFQELSHARGAEQEDSENHIILLGRSDQFVGGVAQFWRCVHVRELVFFVQAHRHAQIVLAEE